MGFTYFRRQEIYDCEALYRRHSCVAPGTFYFYGYKIIMKNVPTHVACDLFHAGVRTSGILTTLLFGWLRNIIRYDYLLLLCFLPVLWADNQHSIVVKTLDFQSDSSAKRFQFSTDLIVMVVRNKFTLAGSWQQSQGMNLHRSHPMSN